jgi:hypothetical protein
MGRTGQFRYTSLAAGLFQLIGTGLLLLLPATADRGWILSGYLLATAGNGCGGPTFMIAYQNALDRNQLGAGTGLFSLARQFGASVSTAVAGAIVGTGVIEAGVGAAAGAVVQQAFVLPLLGGVAVLVSAVMIPKMPLRTTHHDAPSESWAKAFAETPTAGG